MVLHQLLSRLILFGQNLFRLGEPILPHLLEKLTRNRHAGGFADHCINAAIGADGGIVQIAIPLGDLAGTKRLEAIETAAELILLELFSIVFAVIVRSNQILIRVHMAFLLMFECDFL